MNINLHIERLVLDGLTLTRAHAAAIQAAVETELARQLGETGLSRLSDRAVRNVSGGQIHWTHESTPAQTGHQIAHAVHSALVTPRPNGNPGSRNR